LDISSLILLCALCVLCGESFAFGILKIYEIPRSSRFTRSVPGTCTVSG